MWLSGTASLCKIISETAGGGVACVELVHVVLVSYIWVCLIFGCDNVQNSRYGQKVYSNEESENDLVSNLKKSNPHKFLR